MTGAGLAAEEMRRNSFEIALGFCSFLNFIHFSSNFCDFFLLVFFELAVPFRR